jgi:hypothetical protein
VGSLLPLVSSGKCGKLSAVDVNGLSPFSSFQLAPYGCGKPQLFVKKPLKPVFAI